MKVSNETKIGALTAVAITVFVLGYNFLKGKEVFTDTKDYYAVFDRIDGLKVSNPVITNGIAIGRVSDLQLRKDGKIVATLTMKQETFVPQNSLAKLISADILGAKAIDLVFSKSIVEASDNDTLMSEIAMGLSDQIAPIKDKAEKMISSIDSLAGSVNALMNDKFKADLQSSMSSLKVTLANFETSSAKLSTIADNVNSLTANLKNNNDKINNILNNANTFSDSLAKANVAGTVARANKALAEVAAITEKINKGEGSMGLLINDKKLYDNLSATTADMDKLMIDLKENPSRYIHFSVFGRKEKAVK